MFDARTRRRLKSSAILFVVWVLAAGCSSGKGGSASNLASSTATTPAPSSGVASATASTVGPLPGTVPPTVAQSGSPASPPGSVGQNADPNAFDPADFPTTVSSVNQWFPLTPGYQSVRQGAVNKGSRRLPHRRVYTVTSTTKEIAGVRAVLVLDQDIDADEVAEQAIDYLAEDTQGNVWYLGSYTEAYEGGQFVNAADAWLADVKGGKPGVLMMANPTTDTPPYSQADVPGEGVTTAKVVKTGESLCVPFDCYTNVLVIQEGGSENTYFAAGVGGIRTEPKSGKPQETEELVNLTQLTAQGLAELSAEALRLDEHARTEASDVFGSSSHAEQTS
jgi:hypothetical protein